MELQTTNPNLYVRHRAKRGIIALLLGFVVFSFSAKRVEASTETVTLYPSAADTCSFSGCGNLVAADGNNWSGTSKSIVANVYFAANTLNSLSSITSVTVTFVAGASGNSGSGQIINLRNGGTNCGATYPTITLANNTYTKVINAANCTNFNSIATVSNFRNGNTYFTFNNSGSGYNINLDQIYITLSGVGSYGVAESNYVCDYNALQCQRRVSGNTGYTSATAKCKVYIGYYCTNNGVQIENTLIAATVHLDAQNATSSAYRIGENDYIGANFSTTDSSWWADIILPTHSGASCSMPYTTQCFQVASDGTLTNFVLKTGDANFKANPPILSSSDWTLDTTQQTATQSATIINNPNDGSWDPFKWLGDYLTAFWGHKLINPTLVTLEGWQGFKTQLSTKFPFSIPVQIYTASVQSIATTSGIPVNSITFRIYGTNTDQTINFNDPDNIVASTISTIKNILTYVIYGLGFMYLWLFARRVSTLK